MSGHIPQLPNMSSDVQRNKLRKKFNLYLGSQQSASRSCTEPDELSLHPHIEFLKISTNISSSRYCPQCTTAPNILSSEYYIYLSLLDDSKDLQPS